MLGPRPGGHAQRALSADDIELERLYKEEGLSCREIAKRLGKKDTGQGVRRQLERIENVRSLERARGTR